VIVVAVVPLEAFFSVAQLNSEQWLFSVIAAFAIIPISEIIKLIKRTVRKRV